MNFADFNLTRRIEELLPLAPKKVETKFTFQLVLIFDALNPQVTPEERIDSAAKILAPTS